MQPISVTVTVRSNAKQASEDSQRLKVTLNADNFYINSFDGAMIDIQDSQYAWVVQENAPYYLVRVKLSEVQVKAYPTIV